MNELLDYLIVEKEIVEKLIEIDNDKMNSKIRFSDYYDVFSLLLKKKYKEIMINKESLFITEGNPLTTLELLMSIKDTSYKTIIFINQGFVAMNKWLIDKFYKIVGNYNIELDVSINYNDYINKDYKVVPIGEDGLNNQVLEDFYE
ncbi:MAG: hypothetical protein ACI4XM_01005 [Candidatus Coprovivens sp.]